MKIFLRDDIVGDDGMTVQSITDVSVVQGDVVCDFWMTVEVFPDFHSAEVEIVRIIPSPDDMWIMFFSQFLLQVFECLHTDLRRIPVGLSLFFGFFAEVCYFAI